ncbi:MAG TPA: hypothetical protein VGO60_18210 [Iamia sp.]|nr:hypothetical protein [Iamia sp.]
MTSLAVARVSHPAAGGLTGLLNWAEAEIARSKVPVVDVLDHWAERGVALPHGYPEPEYGLLFLYGGTGAIAHVDRDELHDANKLDQVLRLAVLRERLALHAHRLN